MGVFVSINRIVIAVFLFFSSMAVNADSVQTIDVLNDSSQVLHISANNADRSLSLIHNVPAYAKSLVVIKVTQLKSLQDMLFEAILNDSPAQIKHAIQAGANVNAEKEGKRPLLWAITFHRTNAVRCLLENGAI
jgi:hypothetical protein